LFVPGLAIVHQSRLMGTMMMQTASPEFAGFGN
jgi:hypothetical protein